MPTVPAGSRNLLSKETVEARTEIYCINTYSWYRLQSKKAGVTLSLPCNVKS